jgi:hypothetical protein
MAGRIRNRRELREQADQAERQQAAAPDAAGEGDAAAAPKEKGKAKTKRPAAPRVRKSRAKKAPPRLCARWGVYDGGMKRVAVFDYNRRAAADAKLAELLGRQKGTLLRANREGTDARAGRERVARRRLTAAGGSVGVRSIDRPCSPVAGRGPGGVRRWVRSCTSAT